MNLKETMMDYLYLNFFTFLIIMAVVLGKRKEKKQSTYSRNNIIIMRLTHIQNTHGKTKGKK